LAKKIDWGLKFYRDVFRLDALHFGLWQEEKPASAPANVELSLENMRRAQERYTRRILATIPDGVKRILDVGCGSGSVARILKDGGGYEITSITPDGYQAEIFKEKNPDVDFRQVSFEDFQNDKKYDLALFAESFQYMKNPYATLEKCQNEILGDGGYILISDYFRKTPQRDYYKTCHIEQEFIDTVSRLNLTILESQDITDAVSPTLDLGAKIYKDYALPTLEIISGYASDKLPVSTRLLSFLLSRQLKKIRGYLYERMSDKLDSAKFRRMMTYKIYLLKKI